MSVEAAGTGVFAVRPRFGRAPVPEILADGVRAALEGTLPLAERIASARPTTGSTARGRLPRGSRGTTARSAGRDRHRRGAGRRPGRACSTGCPRRSPTRGSTSPRPGSRPWGPTRSTPLREQSLGPPVDPEQRGRVDAALVAATGRATRRRRRSTRRPELPVLSVARATVGRTREDVPPCRVTEELSWTAPLPLPDLRRRPASSSSRRVRDGHADDGGECPEWACAECGAGRVVCGYDPVAAPPGVRLAA